MEVTQITVPKIHCHCRRELQKPRIYIDRCNWPDQFPYAPSANFSIAYDDDALYIRFRVIEQCTAALVNEDNGKVWTDSCVEFFVSFDDTGYYNFEFSCIGKLLLAFRKEKPSPTYATPEILALVERHSTIGNECFAERVGDELDWELNVRIPRAAFFAHKIESFTGMIARANFYKCGDNLSKPHFLSWSPIATEQPNFHLPAYFGVLNFE